MPDDRKNPSEWILSHSGVKLTEKVFFAENLKVMIHAGLSMTEALGTLALQAESTTFRRVITILKTEVETGKLLSQSLARFPRIFNEIFVNMIQIGEVSGTLEDSLETLKRQLKKDFELRSRVRSAMVYPIVVLVAMLGIVTALIVFVFPKLLAIFKDFGDVKLPLATRMLIAVSDFVQAHGVLTAVGAVAFIIAFALFAKTGEGKTVIHAILLRMPIFGPISKKINLARFSRTLSSLLKTDIPVVQSFMVTSDVLVNVHYRRATRECAERIKKGATISSALAAHPRLFPPLIVQMAAVGERSGNVDDLLADIADFYERQVDDVLDGMSSIIEPVLILVLGGLVGGIALAVMMPLYALTQAASQ